MSQAKKIFSSLAEYANKNPELRTGQILHNVGFDVNSFNFKSKNKEDLFYLSDEEAVHMINVFMIEEIAVDSGIDYKERIKSRKDKSNSYLYLFKKVSDNSVVLSFISKTKETYNIVIKNLKNFSIINNSKSILIHLDNNIDIKFNLKITHKNATIKLAFNDIIFSEE